MRIALLLALVGFGFEGTEAECQVADYGGACSSNGDEIASMHMSLLQMGQQMRSGTAPGVVKDAKVVAVAQPTKGQEKIAKVAVKEPEKPQLQQHMRPRTGHGVTEVQDWLESAAGKAAKVTVKAQGNSAEIAVNAQDWFHGAEDLKDVQDVLAGAAAKLGKFVVQAQENAQPGLKEKAAKAVVKAQDWLEGAAAKASKVAVKAQGNSAEIAVDAQDWLHGAEDLKDVQDVLAGAAANAGKFVVKAQENLQPDLKEKTVKLAVKAPEKPQLHQHMRPGTDNGGLNEVQDWLAGAATKAAKVAVKAQGNSAEIAVNAQDWLQGAEDLKGVQDVLEGAAGKAAKIAVKTQGSSQPDLKDKLDAVKVSAIQSTEVVEASAAKPAPDSTTSKEDTTDVVPSPVGGRIKQNMKIDSLPHNATHYDKSSKIWPCEYPSMNCNKPDESAAISFMATRFCSLALLVVSLA